MADKEYSYEFTVRSWGKTKEDAWEKLTGPDVTEIASEAIIITDRPITRELNICARGTIQEIKEAVFNFLETADVKLSLGQDTCSVLMPGYDMSITEV